MAYRLTILGLGTFFEMPPQGRLLLMPDGRNPRPSIGRIEPHRARIYVHRDRVVNAANWWATPPDPVIAGRHLREFPIGLPSTLTLTGMEEGFQSNEAFDETQFQNRIIRLKDRAGNVDIDIDPDEALTIAQIPIRRGTLVSRLLRRAIVAQLQVTTPMNTVTITATPDDQNAAPRTLVLAEGTEIVIANIGRNLGAHAHGALENHFRLYALLDTQRRADALVPPTFPEVAALQIPLLQSTHPYIRLIDNLGAVPETQCSVTGCCRC